MAPALSGRGDGEGGWRAAELRSRQLPWDGALNPEPSASPFILILFIFPAKSLRAPAPKQKADRPGSDTAFGSPHALRMPVRMLAQKSSCFVFFSPSFCDPNLWLFLCQCFQPQSLLLLLQNRKAKGEGWLGLVVCVSVRPQQHFPGAGLLPACSSLPSIVDSVLHVPERVVGVFQWEGGTLLLSPLLCPPGFTCVFLEVWGGGALQPPV